MPYTYTPDTPNAQDPMNITQPLILANFQAIPELITVNHVGFNVNAFGTHNVLNLQAQSVPATLQNSINLFVFAGGPNLAELYIEYPTGAPYPGTTQVSIPYTPNPTGTGTSYAGYVQFPSGVKLSYGTFTAPNGSTSISVPQYTTNSIPLNATATTVNNLWVESVTMGQNGAKTFSATKYSSGTATYNYLGIGI